MQMQCNDFFLNPQNRYKAICDAYFSNKDGSPTIYVYTQLTIVDLAFQLTESNKIDNEIVHLDWPSREWFKEVGFVGIVDHGHVTIRLCQPPL